MKFLNFTLAALTLIALAPSSFAENCKNPETQSQADLLVCAKQDAETTEADMLTTYDQALEKSSGETLVALQKSQTAWLAFRALECSAELQRYKNTSHADFIPANCLSELNEARVKQLQDGFIFPR